MGTIKIKLAILDGDVNCVQRVIAGLNTKYADKLEIYSFTSAEIALSTLERSRIDVLIASDSFDMNPSALPKHCGFAYFVDSIDIDTKNGQRAVCKYQRIDLLYRQILSIYSENAENISRLRLSEGAAKVLAFTSPCGGTGTSSMAAACALRYAGAGKKTLYVNLEKLGSADRFFSAEGQFDMSDIIFALKNPKANISLKLESCVKQDPRGVCFFSQPKSALDMMELKGEEMSRLLSEVQIGGAYDYVIVDMDFQLTAECLDLLRQAQEIVFVSDGSELANSKIGRACEALTILDRENASPLGGKVNLLYNKFSNKTGKALEGVEIQTLGGERRFEHATCQQVVKELSKLEVLDKLI